MHCYVYFVSLDGLKIITGSKVTKTRNIFWDILIVIILEGFPPFDMAGRLTWPRKTLAFSMATDMVHIWHCILYEYQQEIMLRFTIRVTGLNDFTMDVSH